MVVDGRNHPELQQTNKCSLADDASGFFFFVDVLAASGPSRGILPPPVFVVYTCKHAQTRNVITNMKTEQRNRGKWEAFVLAQYEAMVQNVKNM